MKWRRQLVSVALRAAFWTDGLGFHLLPKHYYTPIPDYRWLRENEDAWIKPSNLAGIHWDLESQLAWLAQICEPYYAEVAGLKFFKEISQARVGQGYGAMESQVLHCVLRSLCPRKIVEIGSGVSTFCMLHALERNVQEGKRQSELTSIEPFPRKALAQLPQIKHINSRCQFVPDAVFAELGEGDLLFIDTSHAVKTGSEVIYIYLEVIANLPPGVVIHIHNANLPYAYPRNVLEVCFDWQETALLLALLTGNQRLSVLASLSALHYTCPAGLARVLTDYRPQANYHGLAAPKSTGRDFPSSTWLQTV